MAAKKGAVAPSSAKSTAVATMDEQLAQEAAEIGKRIEASQALQIRLLKERVFELPGGTMLNEPLKCVVVDFRARNSWFDRPYKDGDSSPPACIAIGTDLRTMKPMAESPNRQSDQCDGCGMNEFGTSATGEGKACRNQRVLAVLGWNGGQVGAEDPLLLLVVPPASLKAFDTYVDNVAKVMGQPPIAAVTEISFDPTSQYQKLMFKALQPNTAKAVAFTRREEAKALLERKPDFANYEPPTKPKGRRV